MPKAEYPKSANERPKGPIIKPSPSCSESRLNMKKIEAPKARTPATSPLRPPPTASRREAIEGPLDLRVFAFAFAFGFPLGVRLRLPLGVFDLLPVCDIAT